MAVHAQISKSDDAPEGALTVTVGNTTFPLESDPYETADLVVIAEARSHPYLAVDETDDADPDAEAAAIAEFERLEAEAWAQRAEKHPHEDPEFPPANPTEVEPHPLAAESTPQDLDDPKPDHASADAPRAQAGGSH